MLLNGETNTVSGKIRSYNLKIQDFRVTYQNSKLTSYYYSSLDIFSLKDSCKLQISKI